MNEELSEQIKIEKEPEVKAKSAVTLLKVAGYIKEVKKSAQFREANVWSQVIFREQTTALEQMHFFLAFVEQYANNIGDDRRPYSRKTWEKAFEIIAPFC